MRDFSKIVRRTIGPFLNGKGFEFIDGAFIKEQSNGVRFIIAFDNKGIDNRHYNTVIFVNSVVLDHRDGAHCVEYFTGGSLSRNSRKLPCHNADALKNSLMRLISVYDQVIEPYLISFSSCADIADKLAPNPMLNGYCGDLYALAGDAAKAKVAYSRWLEQLQELDYVSDEKRLIGIKETKEKIDGLRDE